MWIVAKLPDDWPVQGWFVRTDRAVRTTTDDLVLNAREELRRWASREQAQRHADKLNAA